jgi:hypothetical protein
MSVTCLTDATQCSEEELHEAVSGFLVEDRGNLVGLTKRSIYLSRRLPVNLKGQSFVRCEGGVNNKVYYVDSVNHGSYVLRVYNNGAWFH